MRGQTPAVANTVCLVAVSLITFIFAFAFDMFPASYWKFRPENGVLSVKRDGDAVLVFLVCFVLVILSEWQSTVMRQWRAVLYNPNLPLAEASRGGAFLVQITEHLDVSFRALSWTVFTLLAVSSAYFVVLTILGQSLARGLLLYRYTETKEAEHGLRLRA